MRSLIVILMLIGAAAAIFYATQTRAPSRHDTEISQTSTRNDAEQATGDDGAAGMGPLTGAEAPDTPGPAMDDGSSPPAPALPQEAAKQSQDLSGDAAGDVASGPAPSNEQLAILRGSLEQALHREQSEGSRASRDLGAARQELASALKERSGLSARIAQLDAETAGLRDAVKTKADAIEDRHRMEDRARQASAAADADRGRLQGEIAALQGRLTQAEAKAQDAWERLARSQALAGDLQDRLKGQDASTGHAASRARDELAARDAAARQQGEALARTSEQLRGTQARLQQLTAERGTDAAQTAQVRSRYSQVIGRLSVMRTTLAAAQADLVSRRGAAGSAANEAHELSSRIEALRKQAADALARADEAKGALSRATASEAKLRPELQASLLQRKNAEAELASLRAENADLAARRTTEASALEKRLADLQKSNAALAADASRVPQLTREIEAAGSAADEAHKLSGQVEAFRKQAADAQAQADEAKGALSRATASEAKLRPELQASLVQRKYVEAKLAGMRAENADLVARRTTEASAWEQRLADIQKSNAALAADAGRVPQLTRDIEAAGQRRGTLEQLVATLQKENQGQLARIDALSKAQRSNGPQQVSVDPRTAAAADAKTKQLEGTLALLRSDLAQAVRDRSAAEDAQQSADRLRAASDAKLQGELKQNALLAGRLTQAEVTQAKVMQTECDPPRKAEYDDRATGDADTLTMTSPEDVHMAPPAPPSLSPLHVPQARVALPSAIPAHVLLRYAHGKARSQERAQALQARLRASGLEVGDAVDAERAVPNDLVAYFYTEDRGIADGLARQLQAPAPVLTRNSKIRLPRPGTIEISVGG